MILFLDDLELEVILQNFQGLRGGKANLLLGCTNTIEVIVFFFFFFN